MRGGVTQWDAHSHITRIICEYCKGIARVHGETHHWVLIKNELFKHMAVYVLWLRTAAAQQRSATARKSQVAVAIALTVCE